ncbi:hypothetical protein KDW_64110 [Dictyobacter vulcani]|uniref:PsbP C-terminal domain-containing protein n=1 Tax=Dictyobacter vulcani TaxID=2607529 RepID=A0A5J4L1T4_9CHLR|nr:hypothetical protein [Dictyobacter vulcani]GER92249.1 hypothetical protein KDW_64110 [Dictyobacter vulcani]
MDFPADQNHLWTGANKDSAEIFTVNALNTQGKKANLDDAVNAMMGTLKMAGKNYKEDPSTPATTKIGGEDWKQKAATMDTNNKGKMVSLKIYSLAVQHGNMSYLMTYSLTAGTADADMKNMIQPILDSYKFV